MRINQLNIKNLRNISDAVLDFSPNINFIQGNNGAGKTTLIEALYLLARARSFKRGKTNSLIQHDKKSLTIFAKATINGGQPLRSGMSKENRNTIIKVNGEIVRRLSDLARIFPIALITPLSQKILDEGPEYRRRLLNWGVFHVEPIFSSLISKYNRALLQRNQALKQQSKRISVWDDLLNEYASEIVVIQNRYLEKFNKTLAALINGHSVINKVNISLYKGWENSLSLKEALSKKYSLDKRRTFTSVGPHRADLMIEIEGRPIKELLSRGQQKYLLILIMLAQAMQMKDQHAGYPVFLMDDFQSELDLETQSKILNVFVENEIQTIITGISELDYIRSNNQVESQLFHVEQGVVSPL